MPLTLVGNAAQVAQVSSRAAGGVAERHRVEVGGLLAQAARARHKVARLVEADSIPRLFPTSSRSGVVSLFSSRRSPW